MQAYLQQMGPVFAIVITIATATGLLVGSFSKKGMAYNSATVAAGFVKVFALKTSLLYMKAPYITISGLVSVIIALIIVNVVMMVISNKSAEKETTNNKEEAVVEEETKEEETKEEEVVETEAK